MLKFVPHNEEVTLVQDVGPTLPQQVDQVQPVPALGLANFRGQPGGEPRSVET